jgi:flavin reductase (DIM6/NTAB) family NADH-FMN oxidoreductase RutF
MAVDAADFRSALACFASGVTVITAVDDQGAERGMTASAFTSLSLDPPLVLVCVKVDNGMDRLLQRVGAFAVNVLGQDQVGLSNRFAGYGDAPADRLDDLGVDRAPRSGLPGSPARRPAWTARSTRSSMAGTTASTSAG